MGQQQICRFCLNEITEEFEEINCITEKMFEALLLKLNLDISRNSAICWECIEIAKICLHFKSICLYIEEMIYSFASGRTESEFDIREIYQEIQLGSTTDEDLNICRFCMTPSKSTDFVPLSSMIDDLSFKMLPEMDIDIIKNPVVCEACKGNLECHLKFTTSCLITEEVLRTEPSDDMNGQALTTVKDPEDAKEGHIEVVWINEDLSATEEDFSLTKYQETCIPWSRRFRKRGRPKKKEPKKRKPKIQHKCSFCAYLTVSKCDLERHETLHRDVCDMRLYQCSSCSFNTRYETSLKTHFQLLHGS